jgi:hypothetical protein
MERMATYGSARRKAQPASLFGDFCNKIGTKRTSQDFGPFVRFRGKSGQTNYAVSTSSANFLRA